ncbi:MAG TPA: hypothetical protein VHC70_13100 [Phycisphaerales bacterium]|nr:hypothetical protein [Phycisphaerales bacterium]
MSDVPAPKPDQIYVGYLPVPARQRTFLRWAVPVMLWLLCAASFLWARSQHSPGNAVWDQAQPVKVHGVIVAHPYPMLLAQRPDGESEFILLVEMGKRGGGQRAVALDGKPATISGWPLNRDGRRMIELEPGDGGLTSDPAAHAPERIPAPTPVGRITLRGVIVDSKCFLGAMKPGEGKTHKECATLCIRGGIPPMLVTRDSAGRATYYLLRAPGGGPIDPAIQPLIADPVEVTGDHSIWGGLNILSIEPADVRRL